MYVITLILFKLLSKTNVMKDILQNQIQSNHQLILRDEKFFHRILPYELSRYLSTDLYFLFLNKNAK